MKFVFYGVLPIRAIVHFFVKSQGILTLNVTYLKSIMQNLKKVTDINDLENEQLFFTTADKFSAF